MRPYGSSHGDLGLHPACFAWPVLALGAVLTLGCASGAGGGQFVKADYKPRVLQAYAGEGDVNPNSRHLLVDTGRGLAFLERDSDGTGILFQTHWLDWWGDHFAVWVSSGDAMEVLVPPDRTRPAFRFDYPPGYYKMIERLGVKRPLPTVFVAASVKLTPIGAANMQAGSSAAPASPGPAR
jgi:hypothetical protein